MSVNYNPVTPTDGLVLCIDPSNPRCYLGSGTTVFDLSGNNNNGTLTNGASVINTRGGRALDFDGVNDVVSCPQVPFTGTGNFSISLWALQGAIRASDHAIKFGTATLNNAVGIFNGSGNNLAIGLHANIASEASLTANLATNVFYHVVGTCTPSRREIWLNGVLQGTSTATVNYDITSTFFNIGAAQSVLVPWNGRLDDIRIYNRLLSDNEIRQLFESKRGKYL